MVTKLMMMLVRLDVCCEKDIMVSESIIGFYSRYRKPNR